MDLSRQIRLASGADQPELVLKGLKILNVFTKDIVNADIAVDSGIIVGIGNYNGQVTVDLTGKYAIPGLINAHCHVESSMVTPAEYCREELRHGVTTLITDPHEIANVAGCDGIDFMLNSASSIPINYFIQLPSCVPSSDFEHNGATLSSTELSKYLNNPHVLGLGEMMDTNGVINCSKNVMDKLSVFSNHIIDGHAPSLTGKALQGYVIAGILTDHESVTWQEAREKLNAGLAVLVREGSASRNLTDIISGVIKSKIDTRRLAFCTDDKHLSDICREGTIIHNILMSKGLGLDVRDAIQMATINAAQIYGLKSLGAIAAGYVADIVILEDLESLNIHSVYKDGKLSVNHGHIENWPESSYSTQNSKIFDSVHLPELSEKTFGLPTLDTYPVIEMIPGQIVTSQSVVAASEVSDAISCGNLRKIAVVERHNATGFSSVGLISGYGLSHGAIATTVAHDSHNMIIVGDNDRDMLTAAKALENCHGGYSIVKDGEVLGLLPLEVGGLMSSLPANEFIVQLDNMLEIAHSLGICNDIDPFITLSFMALPVLPSIRITDVGVFDTESGKFLC